MDTSIIILIAAGGSVVLLLALFLIARWYSERKRTKALAHKDIVERSFVGSSVTV